MVRVRDVAAVATALCGAYFFMDTLDVDFARDVCPKLVYLFTGPLSLSLSFSPPLSLPLSPFPSISLPPFSLFPCCL